MFYTLSRPPTDDHTYAMFSALMNDVAKQNQVFYMWSSPPETLFSFLESRKFSSPVVVIGIKDLLDGWGEFNFWCDKQQTGVQKISEMARRFSNIKFVIFTSLENLQSELNEPNVYIIPWGGDLLNQEHAYKSLTPVLDKNFASKKSFISLNRNSRDHRVVALSYMLAKGLDQHGYISYLFNNAPDEPAPPDNFLDRVGWEFGEHHDGIRNTILTGYSQLLAYKPSDSEEFNIYQHYGNGENDNATNFDRCLRPRYRNSFVEIVSESSFCAPSFNVTEKTANAFFGCNFPILLGGSGIVQHLRDLGLDMFDDVIDHSYDLVTNPFDRITQAIDNNARVLTDCDYVKQQWITHQPRFESNYNIIRNIYQWYDDRTKKMFNEVIQKIC